MSRQSVDSTVLLVVPDIHAFALSNGADQDPTLRPVRIGLRAPNSAVVAWGAAEWVPDAATPTAQVLVGPGGVIVPARGVYEVVVNVQGVVEQPSEPVGKHVVD